MFNWYGFFFNVATDLDEISILLVMKGEDRRPKVANVPFTTRKSCLAFAKDIDF